MVDLSKFASNKKILSITNFVAKFYQQKKKREERYMFFFYLYTHMNLRVITKCFRLICMGR